MSFYGNVRKVNKMTQKQEYPSLQRRKRNRWWGILVKMTGKDMELDFNYNALHPFQQHLPPTIRRSSTIVSPYVVSPSSSQRARTQIFHFKTSIPRKAGDSYSLKRQVYFQYHGDQCHKKKGVGTHTI